MANPVLKNITEGEWEKVATSVTTGQIKKLKFGNIEYLETYRMTGGDAPTDITEGAPIFKDNEYSETIAASSAIDIYISTRGGDGKIRVDL